ncbi:MAG: hypothetical protein JKX94_10160, partial [Sneathiella sp.]|nr:hypothetical protein [Sneathiella sp.]
FLTYLFNLLGVMAVFGWDKERSTISIRVPALALADVKFRHSAYELVALIFISVVMFDGILETPFWKAILEFITYSQGLRPFLIDIKGWGVDILKCTETLGLVLLIGVWWILFRGLCWCMWLISSRENEKRDISLRFAVSLLPIAIAYHLAHYISYLLLAGQLIFPIISDPFAVGWDLFGTRTQRIDIGVVNAENVWWIAASAVVMGHILSVFTGHLLAVKFFKTRRQVILSQIPLAFFMVILTMSSLWILSQPIVN